MSIHILGNHVEQLTKLDTAAAVDINLMKTAPERLLVKFLIRIRRLEHIHAKDTGLLNIDLLRLVRVSLPKLPTAEVCKLL